MLIENQKILEEFIKNPCKSEKLLILLVYAEGHLRSTACSGSEKSLFFPLMIKPSRMEYRQSAAIFEGVSLRVSPHKEI